MEPDESPSPFRAVVSLGVVAPSAGVVGGRRIGTPSSTAGPSLGEEADALIRDLFGCGFAIAGVQSRHDVSSELSEQLSELIDVLDDAIRGIRHTLCVIDTTGPLGPVPSPVARMSD
jgi:hypothetical protein